MAGISFSILPLNMKKSGMRKDFSFFFCYSYFLFVTLHPQISTCGEKYSIRAAEAV